jgi:hypothetical protein
MRGNGVFGVAVVLALVLGCDGSIEPSEDPNIGVDQEEFYSGLIKGHEDITRFGIQYANSLIKSELGVSNFYPTVTVGTSCLLTSHRLLKGNCVTDSPDSTMTGYYGVSSSQWGSAPNLQDLHFTRNYVGTSGVVSAETACLGARARVINAAVLGTNYWKSGNLSMAHYWVGHGMHMIQDGLAKAHTRRTGTLLRTLTDVCSWGRQVSGVCYHATIDSGDAIWLSKLTCPGLTRSWSCLKPEAQDAAYATAGYLRVIARYVNGGFTGDLTAMLNDYFDGAATDAFVDYFHCEQLP